MKNNQNGDSAILQLKNTTYFRPPYRSNTREKIRIVSHKHPPDFFNPVPSQDAFQAYMLDQGMKTPAFRSDQHNDGNSCQFFPKKVNFSEEQHKRISTLPIAEPPRLYLNNETKARLKSLSRDHPSSYRGMLDRQEKQVKTITSQRQQIKFKHKLAIDLNNPDLSIEDVDNKIRKNILKFFINGQQQIKKPNSKLKKLPPIL